MKAVHGKSDEYRLWHEETDTDYQQRDQAKGLPPILVFAVAVAKWSYGTVPRKHHE